MLDPLARREFLRRSACLAGIGTLAAGTAPAAAPAAGAPAFRPLPDPMIGLQVGAVSFVDEGTARVLDAVREMAAVNTLFVASFTYGRGIGGRQPRPNPLPDHGGQEYDDAYHGGNFATPHPEHYAETAIAPEKAPDHPGYDVLADVIPQAHERGLKVVAWYEDWWRDDVPGLPRALEVDVHGRPGTRLCFRNPHTRGFWRGLTTDFLRSYDLDGLMWGSERQGPLDNALSASNGGRGPDPGTAACFCEHCLRAAQAMGIDVDRARAGYLALERWTSGQRETGTPRDGSFVTFWRALTEYPEILQWERLWTEGLRDMYREMRGTARALAPATPMGWHLWHNNSLSPFYRAEQDYARFASFSDFLKVVLYNNCAGPRLARTVRNLQATVLGDLAPEQALRFLYSVLQYGDEAALDGLPAAGLSADYVRRETRRARAGAEGTALKVWAGIDVDVPTGEGEKKTGPEDVYASVKAAFEGGAHGVLLSRKYSEMRLANLRAAGQAIRDLRWVHA